VTADISLDLAADARATAAFLKDERRVAVFVVYAYATTIGLKEQTLAKCTGSLCITARPYGLTDARQTSKLIQALEVGRYIG
jgi:hypothetical protein